MFISKEFHKQQIIDFCNTWKIKRVSRLTGPSMIRFRKAIIEKASGQFCPVKNASITHMMCCLAKLFDIDPNANCKAVFDEMVNQECNPEL